MSIYLSNINMSLAMQTETITFIRYPESRKHFFTNFVIAQWFVKKVAEVKAEGKPARIKRYAAMDPMEMVLEPPLIFNDTAKNFRSCVVDRQAGTLLIDQDIDQVSFLTFLEKSNKSDKINLDGDFSQDVIDLAKAGITSEDILALLKDPSKLSKDPIFHLTKEKDTDNYIILYDNKDTDATFDGLVSWIFNDYTFESIKLEIPEEGEAGYPNPKGETLEDLYCGKVILDDNLLIEKSISFNFIDLKQLDDVINGENGSGGGNEGGGESGGGNGGEGGGDETKTDEEKALEDPTEGGKYGGPGMAGFGLTVESSKDITGITKTFSDIPKVTIPFPYVDKGSID